MKKSEKQLSLSVLMTAFNREKYIAESIQSVLLSTFQDFELLIVDDGSTDRTVEIARSFEILDSRIKVIVNEKNLGDYPNRNRAASLAQGKYIKYVDSDDLIYPCCLETMVKSMEKLSGNVGLACGAYHNKPLPVKLGPCESFYQHFMGGGLFGRSPLSAIIRRDYFEQIGGFNNERMVSDFEFWFRAAFDTGVICLQDGMQWNREHDGQEVVDKHHYIKRYEEIENQYLLKSEILLKKELYLQVVKKYKKDRLKNILKSFLKFR
jgi:glycosyltransferase involved in cell wall biosynthesis